MALRCFHPGAPHLNHRGRLSAQFGRRGGRASLGLPNPRVASGRQESRLMALEGTATCPQAPPVQGASSWTPAPSIRAVLQWRLCHLPVSSSPQQCECPALSLNCPPRAISALPPPRGPPRPHQLPCTVPATWRVSPALPGSLAPLSSTPLA